MSFLSNLGGIINDQIGIGENTSHSLSTDGITRNEYGKLGNYANKIDQTAERYYLEDGFIRDIRPRKRSILFQQPSFYVVIKKRMFSSLQDNVRLDLLEEKERILVAATKRLFQNKTRLLAAYEKLTKIEQLTFESDRFNTYLGPQFLNLLDSGDIFNLFDLSASTKSAIDKLRKVISYSQPGQVSNWTTNSWDAVFSDQVGEGPGTFELTNIASIKTSVSTEWGNGSATLTLEDPYNLLTITEKDIDQALTDVTNPMRTGTFFKFTDVELENRIEELKSELAVMRNSRQASNITFKLSPGSVFSQRVRAIIDEEGTEIKFTYQNGMQDSLESFGDVSNVFDAATSVGGFFSSGSVQIDPRFISGEDDLGMGTHNQLTSSERQKFTEIISNIFTLLDQRQTSRRQLIMRNKEINYARNRMRLFFNGKYVIQPMDTITIWMTSNTGEDACQPGGFAKQSNNQGFNLSQKFDTIIQNINTTLDSLKDPTGDFAKNLSFNDVERLAIAGPDVPNWLWNQFKQEFTAQPTGPCIFSGLVGKKNSGGVSGSWSDGKWTINVQCEDNTGYFSKSMINFKPSVDVFNSSIYDPLTPFDVSFDASTGTSVTDISEGDFPPLLPENKKLLQSGLLTFRSGDKKGTTANEALYQIPSKEISFDTFSAVLNDLEGMVYRWKQGIQTLTKSGRPNPQTNIDQERAVLLTQHPFAGQDIMNVVSLLITGQPYNYGNFLKAAIANGNSIGAGDPVTNTSAAQTYIQGLINDIEKTNLIWGNFVPYKKLTVNSNLEKFVAEQRLDIVTQNARLQQKLRERARLEDQLILLTGFQDVGGAFTYDENGRAIAADPESSVGGAVDSQGAGTGIQTKINALSQEISQLQTDFDSTISNPLANNQDIGLTLVGNDVNSDPSYNSGSDARASAAQKQRDELQLRQKLFKFTARRFWQVRANEDKNLFIVDDQYDKNFDLQAFERKIGNKIEIFNSQYNTIDDQIQSVRKLLGLECFANTQGHIEVRPPLYNRMPSSVFYKMFKDRDTTGVKVFPDYLESLYFSQIKNMFNQIEVIEDEVRLRAIALGARDDNEIINMITSGSGARPAPVNKDFWFLTKFDGDGRIGSGTPIQSLLVQNNPDFSEGWQSEALTGLSNLGPELSKQAKLSKLFTPSVQANAITSFNSNPPLNRQVEIAESIRSRLRIKTGQEPKKISELFGNPEFKRAVGLESVTVRVSQLDRVNVLSQIGNFVSQRQQLLKSVANAIKNLQEGVSVNAPEGQNESIFQGGFGNITKPSGSKNPADSIITPFLNRKTEIPQFLEHMIEYEDEDDIGYQSGRRFVITADRIISLTISENAPPFTMVTVNGLFGEGFTDPPNDLKTSGDGNAITSAYAVDYDMWYQYGFRAGKAIEAPFLSDPDAQCAPYAVATLLAAREEILQGQVEVAGYNEFYQPGDVVYIEDRNLLFYVRQVDHSCSFGKLSTTLQLTYGHSPGEYLPTMLDIVGKIMYASGVKTQIRSERQQMLGSARSIGAIAFVPTGEYSALGNQEVIAAALRGSYGERNKNILSNTLLAVSGSLNQVSMQRQRAKIKLVYYKTSTSDDVTLGALASEIRMWLLYPEQSTPKGLSIELTPLKMNTGSSQKTFGINEDDIIIEVVDMSDINNKTRQQTYPVTLEPVTNNQGPSNAAFAVTRAIDNNSSSPDQFRELLANSVLDIFVSYKVIHNPTTSVTGTKSQAEQASTSAVEKARTSR